MLVLASVLSCRSAPSPGSKSSTATVSTELHNVQEVAPGVYSGSAPEGAPAFEALRAMGVRSVLSVDGARPDVELAEACGLRYAHVPIGYDGVGDDETARIARAIRDLDGPVYVHCHHGKHRGPAAAAVGMIALGRIETAQGVALLEASGTSPSYPGLWDSVRRCAALDPGVIGRAPEAPSVAPVGGYVAGMATIDRAWDHLRLCKDAGWAMPSDHPDLVPAAEAGMVADTLRRLGETDEVRARPDGFIAWMREAQTNASELERLIVAGAPGDRVDSAFTDLGATCKACHGVYRNR